MGRIKNFDALGKLFGVEPPPEKKSQQQQKKPSPQKNIFHGESPPKNFLRRAVASYNFVPLPEKILPAEFETLEGFREHVGATENISGEILLEIETLTPLFLGGNGSKTFAPVGTPIIPGSSLRGMFKNIFKVVTCGAFRGQTRSQKKGEDFNDEHIYFRCLMGVGRYPWTKDLNKLYNGRMTHSAKGKDGKLHPVKSARPGFLICTTDNKYFIAPSIYTSDRKEDRILIREYEKKFNVTIRERNSSCVKWHDTTAYIITGSQASWKLLDKKAYANLKTDDEKKKAGKQFIRFTRLDYVDWSRDHWREVPDEVLTSYRHDRNRRGVDLFKKSSGILERAELERLTGKNLPDVKTLIPCHFLEEDKKITAFGHGQCFRIPYKNRICDAVPEDLRDEKIFDFADALFGRQLDKKISWASRVFFEDATPADKINFEDAADSHPLMQPNPTSYQLYLKQDDKRDSLINWDTLAVQVRGYKFYWHKKNPDWKANKFELNENEKRLKAGQEPVTKKMSPLKAGNKFTGKIRFKNLSAVELGALMMIFDLDGATNAAYKIGMGKPFGFGSVRIKPTLFVEGDDAYTELFDAHGWKNSYREKNPAEYLNTFKNYLRNRKMFEAWQTVMNDLKRILNWSLTERKNWDEQVKSVSGEVKKDKKGNEIFELAEQFKYRNPLPTIFEVVK